jgi:tetratricopeptide (TPR) repeat protein
VDEDRPNHSKDLNPRPPEGVPVELSFEEAEHILLQRVADQKDDPRPAMWELAQLYKLSGRHDQALACLRDLMQRLPDVEQKARCVFTMGQSAEKVGDFVAAVRYYKEALVMEPTHTFTWYFVLNNLGFSLNTLGQYAEGERYCRKAIEVDGSRCNAHKNLGIALAGQGQHREAAKSYVTATQVNSGDTRSLNLLKDLIEQRPELEFEFQSDIARCNHAVTFAAAAIQRAREGRILRVLLGCNESQLDEMFSDIFRGMTGGAVEVLTTARWSDFIEQSCAGGFDLGFFIPNNLLGDEAVSANCHAWEYAGRAIRRMKGNTSTAIIVSGDYEEVTEHGETCRDAGADAVIVLPFRSDVLADAARQVLALH